MLLKGVERHTHNPCHCLGSASPLCLTQLREDPHYTLSPALLHDKIDGRGGLSVGELHLIGSIELDQGWVHIFKADKAVVLEGMGQQTLRTAIEPGPWRQTP